MQTPGSPVSWVLPQLKQCSWVGLVKFKSDHVTSLLNTTQYSQLTWERGKSSEEPTKSETIASSRMTILIFWVSPLLSPVHSTPATSNSSLFLGCTTHGPASGPLHLSFLDLKHSLPRYVTAHSLTSFKSRSKCHLLGEAGSSQPTQTHSYLPSPAGPVTYPIFISFHCSCHLLIYFKGYLFGLLSVSPLLECPIT